MGQLIQGKIKFSDMNTYDAKFKFAHFDLHVG